MLLKSRVRSIIIGMRVYLIKMQNLQNYDVRIIGRGPTIEIGMCKGE